MSAAADIDGHQWLLQNSTAYRLQHAGLQIDGQPFDLTDYPYSIELLDETAPRTSLIKAAQMGITVTAVAKSCEVARAQRVRPDGPKIRGIGYIFPSDRQVLEFSQARMGPFLDNDLYRPYKSKVDSSGLRVINGVPIYFRAGGVRGVSGKLSLANIKSIPFDLLIEDECDEIEQSRREALKARLFSSECPTHWSLSTPTLPGYGIDLEIQSSDGRMRLFKCEKCSEWTCLEEHFPECIAEPTGGEPYYLCMGCREPLNRRHKSEWVAQRPSVQDWRGYIMSHLISFKRTPAQILRDWQDAEQSPRPGANREFYNQVLGRAYAEIEDQLTDAAINRATDQSRVRSREAHGPCAMGSDPGGRDIHYVIGERVSDTATRVLNWGRCSTFSALAQLERKFGVESHVIDQGAEKRAVRAFVEANRGTRWGCQYVEGRKDMADWDPKSGVVRADRTEVLDTAHHAVVAETPLVSFPASDETFEKVVRPQLKNMARQEIRNDETGSVKYRWVVVGAGKNDHIAHAHGYFHLAASRVGVAEKVRRAAYQGTRNQTRRPQSAMVI